MGRLWKWGLIGLVLVAVAAVGFGAYAATLGRRTSDRFRKMPITKGEITTDVNSTGTIQPVISVQIGSFVSGPIIESNVDFNTPVKAGDIMAKIDPRLYKAAVARDEATLSHAQADVIRVEAQLVLAKKNYQRAKMLREKKSTYISDQELDQFQTDMKSLEAQLAVSNASVKQAEANLGTSRANLDYTIITSPVDGVVIDRKIDPGQTVAASFQTPVLFIVAPEMEKRMLVLASVDEADIGQIKMAKQQEQPVSFTVDAYPDDLFEGKITQIRLNSLTTQNVVTYTVVVEAPNPELKLLPGMTANLSFQIEKKSDVLKVPNAALRYFPRVDLVRPQDRPLLEGRQVEEQEESSGATSAIKPAAAERVNANREARKRHVWVEEGAYLRAVQVEIGIADSQYTEVIGGELKDAQQLVVGLKTAGFGQ